MENNSKSPQTLIYCSTWPDDSTGPSLEQQSLELQTYCALNGLQAFELIIDAGPYEEGRIRPGLERVLDRVVEHDIAHVAIYDISRICRDTSTAYSFLKEAFDPKVTEIHIVSWNMSTRSEQCQQMLKMFSDLIKLNIPAVQGVEIPKEKEFTFREKPLWLKLFGLLQDEKFAEYLIKALFELGNLVKLDGKEYVAVHGGYDHLNLFRALGFRIKGENTDNTKLMADVMLRYWVQLKPHLHSDIHRIIEDAEAARF